MHIPTPNIGMYRSNSREQHQIIQTMQNRMNSASNSSLSRYDLPRQNNYLTTEGGSNTPEMAQFIDFYNQFV